MEAELTVWEKEMRKKARKKERTFVETSDREGSPPIHHKSDCDQGVMYDADRGSSHGLVRPHPLCAPDWESRWFEREGAEGRCRNDSHPIPAQSWFELSARTPIGGSPGPEPDNCRTTVVTRSESCCQRCRLPRPPTARANFHLAFRNFCPG